MSDNTQSPSDPLGGRRAPAYRVIILAKNGDIVSAARISVEDDRAIEAARAMVDGHAVELWDGIRFIEHFPSID
ncbi:hypothetical protein [Methylobacterium sp. Leaf86]|uniref:hypothetical protein n=1 Tax=Methylobacterium sp. Leaf86 TaxID=1736242 RepID=UPI0012E77FB6|nr:hypothetical protein [Methylobacterium sp. Leaf86]